MQALILAGGEGTRLRPLTSTVPKPVLQLVNRPFISYMLDWLSRNGVDDIVMSCGFMASEVQAVLGGKAGRELVPPGVRLRYVEEPEPLGTAGPVRLAAHLLGERFLVVNGDILADFDLALLQRFHAERGARATIALVGVEDPSTYGLVRVTGDGRVKEFVEKPTADQVGGDLVNAGAYVLEREVLGTIPEGRAASFEREVFPALVGSGLYGYPIEGYWLDIGTPERYLTGTRDILERRVATSIGELLREDRLSIGGGGTVDAEARLVAPAVVGSGCEIAAGAFVGARVVLGNGCHVARGGHVEGAVLHDGVHVGERALVRDSVVGRGVLIGAGSRVESGAVIGEGAVIAPNSALTRGERIDPRAELSEAPQ